MLGRRVGRGIPATGVMAVESSDPLEAMGVSGLRRLDDLLCLSDPFLLAVSLDVMMALLNVVRELGT